MEPMTKRPDPYAAEQVIVRVTDTANSIFPVLALPVASVPSTTPGLSRDRLRAILGGWNQLQKEVLEQLALFRRAFAEPIEIVGDEVKINEYAMITEKPYRIGYQGDLLEFIRKSDGSIIVSEVRIK